MEPKDYDRLAKSIGKLLDGESFIPYLLSSSICQHMSASQQRKLFQSVILVMLTEWSGRQQFHSVVEHWLIEAGSLVNKVFSIDNITNEYL